MNNSANKPNTLTQIQNIVQNKLYLNLVICCLLLILVNLLNDFRYLFVLGVWMLIYIPLGFGVPQQVEDTLIQKGYIWDEFLGYYTNNEGRKFKIDAWNIEKDEIVIRLKEYRDDFVVV